MNKTAAVYDLAKLTWMNGHYLRENSLEKVADLAVPFFVSEGLLKPVLEQKDRIYLLKVVELVREREKTLLDLARASYYFYQDEFDYDPKGSAKLFRLEGATRILRALASRLENFSGDDPASFDQVYKELSAELKVSPGKLMPLSRLAVSGRMTGPELFDIMAVIGAKQVSQRFLAAAAYIERVGQG